MGYEDELLEFLDTISDRELYNYFDLVSYEKLLCLKSVEHSLDMMEMLADMNEINQNKWFQISLNKLKIMENVFKVLLSRFHSRHILKATENNMNDIVNTLEKFQSKASNLLNIYENINSELK